MFTGLVEATGIIKQIARRDDVTELTITAPFARELKKGQSVSLSGACTTVTAHDETSFKAELTAETLRASRFSTLQRGDVVNLERALPVGSRLDGHIVSGHIDAVGTVKSLKRDRSTAELWIEAPSAAMRYVVYKGSVCVDGISLTVSAVSETGFAVALIPETLNSTSLGGLSEGASVNIETDVLARYVEKLLGIAAPEPARRQSGLTLERLAELGW